MKSLRFACARNIPVTLGGLTDLGQSNSCGSGMRTTLLALAILACGGCTHRQLSRSMVSQASTIVTVEYEMVLDNIAMLIDEPTLLPWHVRIIDGTVQINDEGGISEFGAQWGGTPGFTQAFRAVRSVTEQWGSHPVTDPLVVKTLQDVYHQAIGLPPVPDPPLLSQLSATAAPSSGAEPVATGGGQEQDESKSAADRDSATAAQQTDDASTGQTSTLAQLRGQIEVPAGWFCTGHKHDVPPTACFVGHHRDRYVWVMPDRVNELSQFTLIVLAITKHGMNDQPSRGLVFVRR